MLCDSNLEFLDENVMQKESFCITISTPQDPMVLSHIYFTSVETLGLQSLSQCRQYYSAGNVTKIVVSVLVCVMLGFCRYFGSLIFKNCPKYHES